MGSYMSTISAGKKDIAKQMSREFMFQIIHWVVHAEYKLLPNLHYSDYYTVTDFSHAEKP